METKTTQAVDAVEQRATRAADAIYESVIDMIKMEQGDDAETKTGRRVWSANAGQICVYSFERQIGFNRGVELCSVAERAWKQRKDLKTEIRALVLSWLKPNTAAP